MVLTTVSSHGSIVIYQIDNKGLCFFFLSSFRNVTAAVPQGSVLGPLFFLIYVNDISEHILSLTRLFADDSSLFFLHQL